MSLARSLARGRLTKPLPFNLTIGERTELPELPPGYVYFLSPVTGAFLLSPITGAYLYGKRST